MRMLILSLLMRLITLSSLILRLALCIQPMLRMVVVVVVDMGRGDRCYWHSLVNSLHIRWPLHVPYTCHWHLIIGSNRK